MSTDQNGTAGANVINAHGRGIRINVGVSPGGGDDVDEESETEARQRTRLKTLLIAGAVVVTVLCAAGFVNALIGSGDPSFPTKSQSYPPGATKGTVIKQAVQALQRCAQAVVLQPANCPQEVTDSVYEPTNVHWQLYGDPGDGAYVSYSKGRFDVLGTAIMMATYVSYQRPAIDLQIVRFWAQVSWSNGKAEFSRIEPYVGNSRLGVRKSNPHLPNSAALAAVAQSFRSCIAGGQEPMAPACPQGDGSPIGRVTWVLNGDPIINTRQSFDAATGLIHVNGSYSATAEASYFGIRSTQTQSGNYDAILVMDGGKPVVLRISDT